MRLLSWVLVLLVITSGAAEAGPVGAAIAAASSWFAAQSVIAQFAIRMAVSFALSAVARAMQKQPVPAGLRTDTTTAGEDTCGSFILGKYATSGFMACPPMSAGRAGDVPNAYLTYVQELGDVPYASLDAVWIGDDRIQPVMDPGNDRYPDHLSAPPGSRYHDRAWFKFFDGRQTAAYQGLLDHAGGDRPWSADMIGRGIPYVVCRFKYDREVYTGFPSVLSEVTGIGLYDPRKDSTVGGSGAHRWGDVATYEATENPAVMIYNILRGITLPDGSGIWGGDAEAADLPLDNWFAAMNECDVAIDGVTQYRAGYEVKIGPEYLGGDEPASVIDELLRSCAGQITEFGGVWKIRVGGVGLPVAVFTDDDIIISADQKFTPFPALDAIYNGVQAQYPEPAERWSSKEAPPRYSAAYEAEDWHQRRVASLRFAAVPYGDQVQRLMRSGLEEERRFRRHELTLPPEFARLEPLDAVAWASARNGYGAKVFEITSQDDDLRTILQRFGLRERDPGDYGWQPDFRLPTTIGTPGTSVPAPRQVLGFAVEPWSVRDAAGAARRPAIRMTWNGDQPDARALRWQIRPAGQTVFSAQGSTHDVPAGQLIVSEGLVAAAPYEVRGRLVMVGRATAWSAWLPVTTPDVRLDREDLVADLRDALADFDRFVADTPALLDSWRDEIEGDIAAVDARVTAETADLSVDVAAARQLALDNLLVAQNYTDTSVQSETVARQTETGALAARIDQISAAPTSNNLLANSDFSDGYTGWLGNGTVANGKATVGSAGAWQIVDVVFSPGEILQWRIEHSGPAGTALTYFQDSAGAWIGTQVATNLPASTAVKIASGQHTPPEGAAKVRFLVQGSGLVIDNAAVTKIDQQVLSRIQSLEVATASDTQALATFKSQTNTRFGQNEAAITAEATARSDADSALSQRVSSVESTTSGHGARISTTETTLADTVESIGQLRTTVEAESGQRNLVRDPTFADVARYWNNGALTPRLVDRDPASSGARVNSAPAPRFWNLTNQDANNQWRGSGLQSVTAGEVIEVSFDYWYTADAPRPHVQLVYYGPNRGEISSKPFGPPAAGAKWQKASFTDTAPAGAVYAVARVLVASPEGKTSPAGITNVSALRTGAGYASKATVETLAQTQSDDVQALANYKTQVASRFENVEEGVQANANALLNVYTKSATNQAIAGQISEYNADVTNRLGQKASASTVAALDSRVKDTEDGLVATGNAITSVNSTVDKFSAGGLFRVQTVATPSDASSRIAIAAAASAGGATTTAGLYLDAVAGGKSRAVVVADLFAIASSTAPDAPKQFPFVVSGGNIWMDASVWIKDLTIGPNKVQIDGLSVLRDSTFAEVNTDVQQAWVTVGSLSLVAYEAGTKLDITGHIFLTAQIGGGNSISVSQVRVLLNGVSLYDVSASGVTGVNPGQYYETSIRQSVAVVGRSVAGTNTVQVQVRQRQNSITPKGAAAATIFVKEFRR